MIEVAMDPRPDLGHLGIYLRLRQGKVHETVDLHPGLLVDLDHEGNILGIDITRAFAPTKNAVAVHGTIDLGMIAEQIAHRFSVRLDTEFEQVREACKAFA